MVIVRVYYKNKLEDIELADRSFLSIGSHSKDDVCVTEEGIKKEHIRLAFKDQKWTYKCNGPMRGGDSCGVVQMGKLYVLEEHKIAFQFYVVDDNDSCVMDLCEGNDIVIGRDADCTVSVKDKQISGKHAILSRVHDCWEVRDAGSSNGSYVNGQRITKTVLKTGDVIDVGLCHIAYLDKYLSIRCPGKVTLNIQKQENMKLYEANDEYPYEFHRAPRLLQEIEEETVQVDSVPSMPNAPEMNWFSVLVPPLASMGIMFLLVFFMGFSSTMLMFSAPTTVLGIVVTIVNYRKQKKKIGSGVAMLREKYVAYLREIEGRVTEKQDQQRKILTQANPAPCELMQLVKTLDHTLWERRGDDEDFMALRLGLGAIPSCVKLQTRKEQFKVEENDLEVASAKLAERVAVVSDCPILLDFQNHVTTGITGERKNVLQLTRNLILEAAYAHSYDELKIVLLCDENEWEEWSFLRWLPHVHDEQHSSRYIAVDSKETARLLNFLEEEATRRFREKNNQNTVSFPYYLIVAADGSALTKSPLMKYLNMCDPALGFGAIYLYDKLQYLPKECGAIVELKRTQGTAYARVRSDYKIEFIPDKYSLEQCRQLARIFAPIRLDTAGKKGLPLSVSFLRGYGVQKPAELHVLENWKNGRPEKGMAVPIGVRENGEPFYFDIHEKAHGPHGLVAGMTGSGKSEMIQSWILSMAVRFAPSEVAFVLVDFKGTGLILPFRKLPHLAGTISDLDKNITRNLVALEKELERRKELLNAHGVTNIAAYKQLLRSGKVTEAMPYLFVVIDEFAEFKVQFPEFMTVVDRIFAIGRTLGVHMILLTQKPSGVVDEKMNANTRFRWCLKVASGSDSRDMLGTSDAAYIMNPGRAYVRVGEHELLEPIQSYWSGASYLANMRKKRDDEKVYVVDRTGERKSYDIEGTIGYRAERSEIEVVVDSLAEMVETSVIECAKPIWTNRLAEIISLDQIIPAAFDGGYWKETEDKLSVSVGLVDDPALQAQYPLVLNFSEQGHAAVYGAPGTGKTTFVQTAVLSLALSYTPDKLHMYLMDFGGGGLQQLQQLPHVGDAVNINEEEKTEKLVRLLEEELKRRKALFASVGALGIQGYREISGQGMPYIILAVDNFAPVYTTFPGIEAFFMMFTREGGTYGMFLLASANVQSNLGYRVSQNIRMNLALQMVDRGDYNSIVGRTGGLEPEAFSGRGLVRGTPPLEFQTALPVAGKTERERLAMLREIVSGLDHIWDGERPKKIAVMPEQVAYADICGDGVAIGLAVQDVARVVLDTDKAPYLFLSEKIETGRYAVMAALAKQFSEMENAVSVLYDPLGHFSRLPEGITLIHKAEDFDSLIEQLVAHMEERRVLKRTQQVNVLPPVFVGICDFRPAFDAILDDTVKRIVGLMTLGQPLGYKMTIAGMAEELLTMYQAREEITRTMLARGNALLMGGTPKSHSIFQTGLGYKEADIQLEADEGYYIASGHAVKLKLVSEVNEEWIK